MKVKLELLILKSELMCHYFEKVQMNYFDFITIAGLCGGKKSVLTMPFLSLSLFIKQLPTNPDASLASRRAHSGHPAP